MITKIAKRFYSKVDLFSTSPCVLKLFVCETFICLLKRILTNQYLLTCIRTNNKTYYYRPFQWQVWPAILVTLLVAGPTLYAIIAMPNAWQPRFRVRSHARLFFDCSWFTTTIILRQSSYSLYSDICIWIQMLGGPTKTLRKSEFNSHRGHKL